MEPYYQDEYVTIYHGDCREILPEVNDIQLLATSPPYNVGLDYIEYNDNLPWPRWYEMLSGFIDTSFQALRSGGILALNLPFVANTGELIKRSRRERKTLSRGEPVFATATQMVKAASFLLREPLVWVKSPYDDSAYAVGTGIGSDNNPYLRMAAEVFILASKDHYHMMGGTGKRGARFSRPMDWCKNVWHIRAGWQDGDGNHPAPWSRELCQRLLLMWSNPGDLVCDAFSGSGKFLLEAKRLGRKAIGIDIVERYCEIAANRCQQMVMNLN